MGAEGQTSGDADVDLVKGLTLIVEARLLAAGAIVASVLLTGLALSRTTA